MVTDILQVPAFYRAVSEYSIKLPIFLINVFIWTS